MKVFLDTNILFSGSQSGSRMRALLDCLQNHATLTTHPGVLEEARRNLSAKKPDWIASFDSLCTHLTISTRMGPCPVTDLAPKDQPVLAAAVASGADRLVTGDRCHFGSLYGKTIHSIHVCSTRQLAKEMRDLGWLKK